MWWQKKKISLQMQKTVFQRAKSFLNVKMINLEISNRKSPWPPPSHPTLFSTQDLPLHRTSTAFLYFFRFPLLREVIKIYSPLWKGESELCTSSTLVQSWPWASQIAIQKIQVRCVSIKGEATCLKNFILQ